MFEKGDIKGMVSINFHHFQNDIFLIQAKVFLKLGQKSSLFLFLKIFAKMSDTIFLRPCSISLPLLVILL